MVNRFPYNDQLSQYYDAESSWLCARPLPPLKTTPPKPVPESAAFDLLMALFAFAAMLALLVSAPANPGCLIPLLVVHYALAGLLLTLKAYHRRNQRS